MRVTSHAANSVCMSRNTYSINFVDISSMFYQLLYNIATAHVAGHMQSMVLSLTLAQLGLTVMVIM